MDSRAGRWTQTDPVRQPAQPRDGSAYIYAQNDPISLSDPSGAISVCGSCILWGVYDQASRRVVRLSKPFVRVVKTSADVICAGYGARAALSLAFKFIPGVGQASVGFCGGWGVARLFW